MASGGNTGGGPLDLVPIFLAGERKLMDSLAARLSERLAIEVRHRPPWFDPEQAYDASRGQYDSSVLLRLLALGPPAYRVLGVAGVDLFLPVLTYVFGEGQLAGPAAVVSVHRLRPEAYGLPVDAGLLAERLEKEALHELGHTWGLLHCRDVSCVMRSSTWVDEIDFKPAQFCGACHAVLNEKRPWGSETSHARLGEQGGAPCP